MRHPDIDQHTLALFILKAQYIADQYKNQEIYWHTREKCTEVCRDYGVSIPDLIMKYEVLKVDFRPHSIIEKWNHPMWIEVAHPEVIIEEVCRS